MLSTRGYYVFQTMCVHFCQWRPFVTSLRQSFVTTGIVSTRYTGVNTPQWCPLTVNASIRG